MVIAAYFIAPDGTRDWQGIWLSFAGYALAVAILFVILFRYKHTPAREGNEEAITMAH